VQSLVADEMGRVYGAQDVAAVALVHTTHQLDAAAGAYEKLKGQFEDALDWYEMRLEQQEKQRGRGRGGQHHNKKLKGGKMSRKVRGSGFRS
jgi:hypothetical protein